MSHGIIKIKYHGTDPNSIFDLVYCAVCLLFIQSVDHNRDLYFYLMIQGEFGDFGSESTERHMASPL